MYRQPRCALGLQALSQLRSRIAARWGINTVSEDLLQWYLRDRYFDVDEAENKLSSMLRWRQSFM